MEHLMKRQAAGAAPAAPPPPGITPNFVNPDYIGGRVIIIVAVFLGIALACFFIRMFTRIRITRGFGADDVALIAGMIVTAAEFAIMITQTQHGLGYHIWEVRFDMLSPGFTMYNLVSSHLYTLAVCLVKVSVLLLYLRLSPAKAFRAVCYLLIFVLVANAFANIMAFFLSCRPFRKEWDLSITDGKCIDRPRQSISSGYFNIFMDAILLVLPLPTVWKLQLPLRQKIAVTGVFMTGSFCLAMSIVRLHEFFPLIRNTDITWNTVNASIWSILELDVGIICASLATFQPFLKRYFPALIGKSRAASYPYAPKGYPSNTSSHTHWARILSKRKQNDNADTLTSYSPPSDRVYGLAFLGSKPGSGPTTTGNGDVESLNLNPAFKPETEISAQPMGGAHRSHWRGGDPGDERDGRGVASEKEAEEGRASMENGNGMGIVKTTDVSVQKSERGPGTARSGGSV